METSANGPNYIYNLSRSKKHTIQRAIEQNITERGAAEQLPTEQGATAQGTKQQGATGQGTTAYSQDEPESFTEEHDPELDLAGDAEDKPTIHIENYECARASYNWKLKGQQREMTPIELETMYLWVTGQIHLDKPPKFISETHTGQEQDAFLQFHRTELGFRLYARLPAGFRLSESSGKWHLCYTLFNSAKNYAVKNTIRKVFNSRHQSNPM